MPITTSVRAKKTLNEVFGAKEVQWGPIGKEVYLRTYSRLKPDGTQETWQDTVLRVVDGNLALVNRKFHEPGEREKLLELIYSMDMIPAGRHLWVSGVPGRQFLFNCHSAGFSRKDFTAHFTFTFEELMKGGGVGSNYSNKHIEMYPPVFSKVNLHIVCNPAHPNVGEFKEILSREFDHYAQDRLVVDDSREGWSTTLQEVLLAAWHGKDSPLIVDMSMLRERGALLKSFGGKSSGPGPLVIMLKRIADLLSSKVGKKLTSLDMMQIDHELATCVVSGNIRRSARMSIKHWADPDILEFIKCKHNVEHHWSTNISVEVDERYFQALRRGEDRAKAVLKEVSKSMHKNGEPGFWNSSFAANGEVEYPFTTNPCVTGDTLVATPKGPRRADEFKIGDELLTAEGTVGYVKTVEKHKKSSVYELLFSDGGSIKATGSHQFHALKQNEKDLPVFKKLMLEELRPGDVVRKFQLDGGSSKVSITSMRYFGQEDVYDLFEPSTDTWITNGYVSRGCGEISFEQWEDCNLGHINLERFAGDADRAREAFRLMARFLVRATFGDVLNPYQKAVQDRNRRIGVGFFGFHPWLVYQGVTFSGSHHNKEVRNLLKSFKMACRDEARRYAFQLRIPEPIKVTTIAPTGTISLLPGTTSGCQPIFARYYKRLVNYSSDDTNLKALESQGYPIEDSVYTKKTKVVTFFCKDPLVAECERRGIDLSLLEDQHEIEVSDHLAVQAMLQDEYADNSISYTINFRDHDVKIEDIELALKVHLPHLKGTTLMPENDSRPQTPFQRITHAQFEEAERKGIGKVSDKEMECLNGVCPVK